MNLTNEMDETSLVSNNVFATKSSFNESLSSSLFLADDTAEFEGQDISLLIATTTEAIFLLLIFAASVVSNTLVFVIFYQRPALRSLSNRFVLNLALCDLLYSVLVIPYVMVSMVSEGGAVGVWWCRFTKVATVLLALGCAFSTVLIGVDRYCAVMNPLHYSMTITRARCSCMIAAIWMLAIVLASLPLASLGCPPSQLQSFTAGGSSATAARRCDCWTTVAVMVASAYRLWYSATVSSLGFLLPLALLCWIYLCMYRAAKRSSVRVRRRSNPLNPATADLALQEALTASSGECTPISNAGSGNGSSFQAFRMKNFYRRRSSNASLSVVFFREEGKAAQTGLLVLATFAFCWLPYFAFLLLEAHPERKALPTLGRILAQHLTFVGCALNPFVYVYRNRVVWKDARHVLHCGRSGNNNTINYALQRHHQPPSKPASSCHHLYYHQGHLHHHRLNNINNNNIDNGRQILLLNKDLVCWKQASRSLLRIAAGTTTADDRRSSDNFPGIAEAGQPPEGLSGFRVSITEDVELQALQEPTTITLVRDCLKVEVVHRGSSWSLPNQNVTAYLIGDPLLKTNACVSDNYLTDACSRQETLATEDNVNNNNNDEDDDHNANNYNASVDNRLLGAHSCGNSQRLLVPPAANHNRCSSATSLIFRVAPHQSYSYPGTTI